MYFLFCFLILSALSFGQDNLDFSNQDFTNWNLFTGSNYTTPTNPTTSFQINSPLDEARHSINTINDFDPNTNDQLQIIPDGEPFSARLGNSDHGEQTESMNYTLTVDANNNQGFLYYKYAIVFENPTVHYTDQPKVIINVYLNDVLLEGCESYQVDANTNEPEFMDGIGQIKWKDWTAVGFDLNNYNMGDELRLEFINYDCGRSAHFGYTYVTAGYIGEGNVITHEPCNADGNYYLTAPDGFNYLWSTGETTQIIALSNPEPGSTYSCELTLTSSFSCANLVLETATDDYFCCQSGEAGTNLTNANSIGDVGYSSDWPPSLNNTGLYIDGTFYVDADLELYNCIVNFGENAKIIVFPGVSFDDKGHSEFQPCDNSFMWDGIYDESSNASNYASISLHNSTFYGAKSAINTEKYTEIEVNKSEFRNCHTALQLRDYDLNANNATNKVEFTESNILGGDLNETCEGASHSMFGIKVYNSKNVTLGLQTISIDNTEPYSCEFNNLKYAIYGDKSKLRIENAVFKNPYSSFNMAVFTYSASNSSFDDVGLNVQKCKFEGYKAGILQYGAKAQELKVEDCEFKNTHTGIASSSIGSCYHNIYGGAYVKNSNFYDNDYAIRISGFDAYTGITIEDNYFENTKRKSVWLRNMLSWFPSNNSNNSVWGILVQNNTIEYNQPVSEVSTTGISLGNCNGYSGARINNNSLSYYARPNQMNSAKYRGIEVKDVMKGYVMDNNIVNWGDGIRVTGHDEMLKFKCNEFTDCYKGFRFASDLPTGESYITQQGSSYAPHNNYFYGDIEQRFAGGVSMEDYINWYINPSALTNIEPLPLELTDYINQMNTYGASPCTPPAPSERFAQLANNTSPYKNTAADARKLHKTYLYKARALSTDIPADQNEVHNNEFLNNFHDLLSNSNIAKLVGVSKHISKGEFTVALEINESVLSDVLSDLVSKNVNEIWLNTWAQNIREFTAMQRETLLSYALLTPHYGGEAVYMARIMLDIDIDDYGIDYRTEAQNENEALSQVENSCWKVYTNNSYIYIQAAENASAIEVYDIMGRSVYSQTQEMPESEISNFNLSPLTTGTYVYQIFNKNEQRVHQGRIYIN